MNYLTTIGLEVHCQLNTDTKMFCSCKNQYGNEQNTNVCPVCLGMPGVLPVINQKAIDLAIRAGVALNCTIYNESVFDRKNYFYPDLPKGYQISQFDKPIALGGYIEIPSNGGWKKVGITRIHLEEDAGKSMHPEGNVNNDETRVDINRSGVPLIEIVSEPEIYSPQEAHDYLTKLKQILLYIMVSDCNMEEGSLRCDANVSIRPETQDKLGTRTELKNLNSFKFVKKGIQLEVERQKGILESGGEITQMSMSYDASTSSVKKMRTKEDSDDYRYFPEPDLIPLKFKRERVDAIIANLPELPKLKKERLEKQYGITAENADVMTNSIELADYFEKAAKSCKDAKKLSNWILSEVLMILKEQKIDINEFKVSPEKISELVNYINAGTISGKTAKEVFAEMVETGKNAETIIKDKGLEQISDTGEIESIIDKIIADNDGQVQAYKNGKDRLFGFFVGQVMKATKGQANPAIINQLLKSKLNS